MNFEELNNLNQFLKNEYVKKTAIKNRLKTDLEKENKNIQKYDKEIELYEKKKTILQEASDKAREYSKTMFELIATEALKTILGDNLSVVIKFGENSGNKTAEFLIKAEYGTQEVIVNPTDEDGGGAADIVSLSSLISMNSFLNDENGAPLVFDEPTKFVSKGNAKDVSIFLSEISKEMNKQIIMVTHDGVSKEIADKSYEITLDETGTSKTTDVTKV